MMTSKITVTIAATIALLLAINTFGIKAVQAQHNKSTANDHCDINCRLKMVEAKLGKAYPLGIHTVRLPIGCTVGKYLEHQD